LFAQLADAILRKQARGQNPDKGLFVMERGEVPLTAP
jgi:hypothetical protein